MTLNASGPISLAGATTGQSIAVELGLSATGQISLNDATVRTLAGVPSGAIVMPTDFYGKSNRVTASITLSANTANYTLNTAAVPGYSAGKTDVQLTINNGVYISSASTGSYAFTVASGWTSGDTLTITNNGVIVGRGGNGGSGTATGNPPFSGATGGSAGPALNVNYAITMNNTNGRIAGGGGGGGSGGQGYSTGGKCGQWASSGGGGGGGIGGSSGGTPSNAGWPAASRQAGSPGTPGTLTAAGPGGSGNSVPDPCYGPTATPANPGAAGGGYGSGGGTVPGGPGYGATPGGAAGAAIVGNSNITYTPGGTGIRNGSIS